MKIDDKQDRRPQFVELEWGEVFRLDTEPRYFMKVPIEITNEDKEINVVELEGGRLGYVASGTRVERIPEARLVIE